MRIRRPVTALLTAAAIVSTGGLLTACGDGDVVQEQQDDRDDDQDDDQDEDQDGGGDEQDDD